MKLGLNGRFLAARLTGVQRVAHGLCGALFERTDAALFVPANARVGELPGHVRVLRGVLRGHAWEQLELPRMARAAQIDLLINPANSGPWTGSPHALFVHDVLPLTHPQWFSRSYALFQRHALRWALARASHVFTSTHCTAEQILRISGAPPRVHVVTQGLQPFHAPASAADVTRVRAQLDLEGPFFLFVGLGDGRKNMELLVRALREVQATRRFTLVAVGKRARRIHSRSAELGALPWLRVVEHATDAELRALYSGALALCFPSWAEGFGRPPLEALACGAPAVVGDYAAAHELLGDAVPILPFQAAPWIEQLRRLLDDPMERTRLVQRGTAQLERFDWGLAAEQMLSALKVNVNSPWRVTA
ncbi:MAG: glycosyltransferase family 4 protein [Longimicrobiales bacterium]